ncbi:MAG: zinc ribbon domain-containing protein [Bdellovibrionota bacterium]
MFREHLAMIYEYKCSSCNAINEFWMKMSDPAPTECPSCKGSELEKVISKTSFALKGSGWYTTDYKKPSASSTKAAEKSETPASTGGSCCSGGSCSHKS